MIFLLSHGLLELKVLAGAEKLLRHKVEVLVSVKGLHLAVAFAQRVFSGDLVTPWEVIDFHESAKLTVDVCLDHRAAPYQYAVLSVQELTAICTLLLEQLLDGLPVAIEQFLHTGLLKNVLH